MLTPRGRVIFALGFVVYVVAWAFGSRPLYPVATGLLLVVGVAWAWVRLSDRPFRVEHGWGDREHVEGDDVSVVAELGSTGTVRPASVTLSERVGRLGNQRHVLRRIGRRFRVRYVLERVPRGRYVFQEVHAELADPFGLEQAIVHLPAPGALLVYPRLARLGPLFTESGTRSHDGQRLLLRRHSGFELHSVREYEQGESLRRVHWPSTARRGQLMVKELEDSPRDEIAVLLDADAKTVVGESFETQVRAAGSILDAYVRRGRRGVLVLNSERREVQHVHSPAADWRRALELLAAVEATGHTPVARLLAEEDGPAARPRAPCNRTRFPASCLVASRGDSRVGAARGLGCVFGFAAGDLAGRGRVLRPTRFTVCAGLPRLLRLPSADRSGRPSADACGHPGCDLRIHPCGGACRRSAQGAARRGALLHRRGLAG